MAAKNLFDKMKAWSGRLKSEIKALYLAFRHPDTPVFAKVWVGCVVAYAISPIDLIPDFIPIIGYLDDLVLLPLGIWLAIKMIPPDVLAECRSNASKPMEYTGPIRWVFVLIISIFWIGIILSLSVILWKLFSRQ